MADITDQIIDFYNALFGKIFFEPFSGRIAERRRRDAVRFLVLEAAGAASQSLERFFISQQLTSAHVECVLSSLESVTRNLTLEQIANPYTAPERIVEDLLALPESSVAMEEVAKASHVAVYRVALDSVVQGLMQIGPVMAEWQNIGFPSTFELSRRVIVRLNEISTQLDVLGLAGSEAADERYELQYRDYLSQRFYRVEAGTVRMTTNLSVDLRELFVMPNVLARVAEEKELDKASADPTDLMPLSRAREALARAFGAGQAPGGEKTGIPVLEQVKRQSRNVIVGAPGSGKSTVLEWFQLKVANAEEEFVLARQQAIPLLLRVRQLDPSNLPTNSAMVEKATASRDFSALMPIGWVNRQMSAGRVVFMLDGLDEVDPHIRDTQILPWFAGVCKRYPRCSFIVSSRPVGYPVGLLRKLSFSESELLDFTEPQIAEYARHWCTAIRLARNETLAEARREGAADGDRIVSGFGGHPYIKSLARNPLMLSAICLVNYFEGGQLPKDRAVLYRLCVEGLLHNWDQRRGILSDFTFEEKLRACREAALHMQANDRAEYELTKVQDVFSAALRDVGRAASLLEHVRYRTGLLLERRPGVFAFAHLTFQEYLAARAIHEGNQLGIGVDQLLREHGDPRWQEVIALYCGLAPVPAAMRVIDALVDDATVGASLLGEAYFAAGPELAQNLALRRNVMRAMANRLYDWRARSSSSFAEEEFSTIANQAVGNANCQGISYAFRWFMEHQSFIDFRQVVRRLGDWSKLSLWGRSELNCLVHNFGDDNTVAEVARDFEMYASSGSSGYETQAELAIQSLRHRDARSGPPADGLSPGIDSAWLQALIVMAMSPRIGETFFMPLEFGSGGPSRGAWRECAPLIEQIRRKVRADPKPGGPSSRMLDEWLESLKRRYQPELVDTQSQAQPEPSAKKPRKKKR